MRISGFSIVKNGDRLGYPYTEALRSLAPFVHEIVVAHGDSTDTTAGTLERLKDELQIPLRVLDSPWDPTNTRAGSELARQTNIALKACKHPIRFYIQADEVLCEEDSEQLSHDLERFARDPEVSALALQWEHFYGNYDTVVRSREWYRREIRVIKSDAANWQSYGDAQGFRIQTDGGRWVKGPAALSPARMYHYGWVRPPAVMIQKSIELDRLWHGQDRDDSHTVDSIFPVKFGLTAFTGKHPSVMSQRMSQPHARVSYTPDDNLNWLRLQKLRASRWIENQLGWRPGEFKNYSSLKVYPALIQNRVRQDT
jgi:hypothetical protein